MMENKSNSIHGHRRLSFPLTLSMSSLTIHGAHSHAIPGPTLNVVFSIRHVRWHFVGRFN